LNFLILILVLMHSMASIYSSFIFSEIISAEKDLDNVCVRPYDFSKKGWRVKIKLAPMTEDDVDEVLEIENLSFASPWSKRLFLDELVNPNSHITLAKGDIDGHESILGFACFWIVADETHILNIAVHPGCRRRGIAKSLLTHVLEFAKNKGINYFALEVRNRNQAAIEFYKGFGFKAVGVRKGYYADTGEDAILMELELKGQANVSS